VYGSKNFFEGNYLHQYKAFYWIGCVQMVLSNLNLIKCLWLVKINPSIYYRGKTFLPYLKVKSKFTCAHSCQLLQLTNNCATVESLKTSINIGGKSKEGWSVLIWNLIDHCNKISDIITLRNFNDFRKLLLSFHS